MLIKLSDTEIWNKDCIEYIGIDEPDKQVYVVIRNRFYDKFYRIDIGPSFLDLSKKNLKKSAEDFLGLLWYVIYHTENGDVDILYLLDDYLNKH